MDLDIQVKCIKEGQMEDGDYFCHVGEIYSATILEDDTPLFEGDEPDENEDFYYVQDAGCNELDKEPHGMDKEFFDEYFEIIEISVKYKKS